MDAGLVASNGLDEVTQPDLASARPGPRSDGCPLAGVGADVEDRRFRQIGRAVNRCRRLQATLLVWLLESNEVSPPPGRDRDDALLLEVAEDVVQVGRPEGFVKLPTR